MDQPEPLACALFLIAAFSLAGLVQAAWLRWPGSAALAIPLDLGRRLRGRRLLGDNKTLRGFAAMVPATGLAFWGLSALVDSRDLGLWSLSSVQYLLLGLWTGFGFMAAELPNSFLKRQLGVAPGEAPRSRALRPLCLVLDRVDSILGLLVAAVLFVPTPPALWGYLLALGVVVHGLFSLLLFRLGAKSRAL